MAKILTVDDSNFFIRLLTKYVSGDHEVVGKANNGEEAFTAYQDLKPDLVLLDITMPVCDGRECLEKILGFDPQAKVIMISGLESEDVVSECMAAGAKGFIKKNLLSEDPDKSKAMLLQKISEVVGDRAA